MSIRTTRLYLFLLIGIATAARPAHADYLQTYVAATCDSHTGRAMVRFGYGDVDAPPKFDRVSKEIDGGLSAIPVTNAAKVEASCSLPGNREVRVRYVSGTNVADTLGEWTVWINNAEIVHGDANKSYPFGVIIEKDGYRTCTFKLANDQWFYDLTPGQINPTPIECDTALSPLTESDSNSSADIQVMRAEFAEADKALNDAYKGRLAQLSADRRENLKQRQRHWLRVRDSSCEISERGPSLEHWADNLEPHGSKMRCATQFARKRAKALQEEVAATTGGYSFEDPELHFASNSDSICKHIDTDLHSDPQAIAIKWQTWEGIEDLNWRDPKGPVAIDAKSQELQAQLQSVDESDFDFFNDGNKVRVLGSNFSTHYMTGSTLLVAPIPSKETGDKTPDAISDPASWFIPCQLESTQYPISECPPFSQSHDEAGLSIVAKGGKIVRFAGRYLFLSPIRLKGTTYIILEGGGSDASRYSAVIRPRPGRTFDTLCLIRH